jgi:hypothetical protein
MSDKTKFEKITDFLKTIIWPLIIVIFFLYYNKDISKIIHTVPKKIEASSKLTVGSISLEIDKSAKLSGNEELGKIIKNLSKEGIRKLLWLSFGKFQMFSEREIETKAKSKKGFNFPTDIKILKELEDNGLISTEGMTFNQIYELCQTSRVTKNEHWKGIDSLNNFNINSDVMIREFEYSISTELLNSKEKQSLTNHMVNLTENGQKAIKIIVDVIATQIKEE